MKKEKSLDQKKTLVLNKRTIVKFVNKDLNYVKGGYDNGGGGNQSDPRVCNSQNDTVEAK